MDYETLITYGTTGTTLGIVGVATSTSDVQAVISIVVTVLGFVISILIPTIMKIYHKIHDAKADGVITKEEREGITKSITEGIDDVAKGANEVIDKINKEKDKDGNHN